jgi:S-adenosylmethionine decarboxylase
LEAARQAKATVVGELFHQFDPVGVSGVLLIAESHVSVHTWPEDAFVAVDIFTCGEEMDAEIAIDVLTQGFRAAQVDVKVLLRGWLEDTDAERGRDG